MDANPRAQFPFKYDAKLRDWMDEHKSEVLSTDLELETRTVSEQLQQLVIVLFLHLGGLAVSTDLQDGTIRWDPTWRFWIRIGKGDEVDPLVAKIHQKMVLDMTAIIRDIYFLIAVEALKAGVKQRSNSDRWLDKFQRRVCDSLMFYDVDGLSTVQEMSAFGADQVATCFQVIRAWLKGRREMGHGQPLSAANAWRQLCMPDLEQISKMWRDIN
jgi:hypothetical protein